MPRRITLAAVVAAVVVSAPSVAHGDDAPANVEQLPSPHVVLDSGTGVLEAPNGRSYFLPVGTHILDGLKWQSVDDELRRLQEAEVRLRAENESLRETASSWQPGWKVLLGTLVVGLAGGAYLGSKL